MKTYARRKRAAGCDAAGGPAKRAALAPDVMEAGGAPEGGADPYAFSTSDEEDASPLPPARECSRAAKLLQAPAAAPSKARWGAAADSTRPPAAGGQAAASAAGAGSPGGPASPQGAAWGSGTQAPYAQHDPEFLRGLVALHGRADSGGDAHSPPASAGALNGPARRCRHSPLCMPVPAPAFSALAREAAGHLTLSRRHGLAIAADTLPARRSLPKAAAGGCADAGLAGPLRVAPGNIAPPDREPASGGPGPLSPPPASPDAARLRGRPAGAGAGEGPTAAGRGAAAGGSQEADRGAGRDVQLRGGKKLHGCSSPGAAARSGSQPGSSGSQPGGCQGARGGAASPAPKRTPQRGRARPPPAPPPPPAAPAAHATVMEVRTASP